MSSRREILNGLLAAFLSVLIVGGAFTMMQAEFRASQAFESSPSPTRTSDLIATPATAPSQIQEPGSPVPASALPTASPTTPVEAAQCNYPTGWAAYLVQAGESLENLANRFGISVDQLASGNCLIGSTLLPGSILYVPNLPPTPSLMPTRAPLQCGPPPGWIIYIVQSGDTLFSIGRAYGVSVSQLMNANCLSSTLILSGQRLYVPNVPTRTPLSSPTPIPTQTTTATNTPLPSPSPSAFIPTSTSSTTPTTTASPTSTATPSSTPSPTPSATLQPTVPTSTPTATPTATPEPSNTPPPSLTPTALPSATSTGG